MTDTAAVDRHAYDLRIENHPVGDRVLGIGEPAPRLSWRLGGDAQEASQDGYEVELTRAGEATSVVVESSSQIYVPWPFAPLGSRDEVLLSVRTQHQGVWGRWSTPVTVETGLLHPDDWTVAFISPRDLGAAGMPAPILTGGLQLDELPDVARAYVTAHGVYQLRLNGALVSDELSPGWTSYSRRLRYQTYDVTSALRLGDNTFEILLGDGWFRGRLGWDGGRAIYGDTLGVILQVELRAADGRTVIWGTDDSWAAFESQVTQHDHYDGEHWDFRRARLGLEGRVEVRTLDLGSLVAPDGPPVRVVELLPATRIWRSPSGRTLVDFGQNLVGRVRVSARGLRPGATVVVRHAEVLEAGDLCTRPLRTAQATNVFRLGDINPDVLEPSLTFQGFRYAEISGHDELRLEDVEAAVLSSDLDRTGWFESSNPLLNQFHENVYWGMRGNFLDVPTDCPQRDERLGWTGDIQVFAPTAQFLADSTGFLVSWLKDLAVDQNADGSVPFVIPDVLGMTSPVGAAWGDAAVLVPYTLYQRSGDIEVLQRQLPSMRAWVDLVASRASSSGAWLGGLQFGDWLDPDAPPDDPGRAKTPHDVVSTAYLVRSADTLARVLTILRNEPSAEHYRGIAARARSGFVHEFVTASGRILGDSATGYSLALELDLVPAELRQAAADRLADIVRCSDFRITTGFVGTPVIADALSSNGYEELALRLLLQTECPSWLYSVTMGATTVWERWDSLLPDGSVNPGGMTSFNHYALGAVADWMHRRLAGLAPAAPGYARISVRPILTPLLDHASARHVTPYGLAAVGWSRDGDVVTVTVEVPPGTTADLNVPGCERTTVGPGTHVLQVDPPADATRRPSTIRELMDQMPSWTAVVAIATATGLARDGRDVARCMAHMLDSPAAAVADGILKGVPMPGEADLRSRLSELLA